MAPLTPRDRMWSAIRALQGDGTWFFSPVEVHFLTNLRAPQEAHVHVDSVISYMEALSRAEVAERPIDLVFGGTTAGMFETEDLLAEMIGAPATGLERERASPSGREERMISHPLSATPCSNPRAGRP